MSGSITDLITVQQKGVQALGGVLQATTTAGARQTGTATKTVTGATLVQAKSGYLVCANVIVAGSDDGFAYDAATIGAADTSGFTNAIAVISKTISVTGSYHYGSLYTNGLVIIPGTSQVIAVTYAPT